MPKKPKRPKPPKGPPGTGRLSVRVLYLPCGTAGDVQVDGVPSGSVRRRKGGWRISRELAWALGRELPSERTAEALERSLREAIRFAPSGERGRILAVRGSEPVGQLLRSREGIPWRASPALLAELGLEDLGLGDYGPWSALEGAKRRVAEEDLIARAERRDRAMERAFDLLEEALGAAPHAGGAARTLLAQAHEAAMQAHASLPALPKGSPSADDCEDALKAMRSFRSGLLGDRLEAAAKARRILSGATRRAWGLQSEDDPCAWPAPSARRSLRRLAGKGLRAARGTGHARLVRVAAGFRDTLDGLERGGHWADVCAGPQWASALAKKAVKALSDEIGRDRPSRGGGRADDSARTKEGK